MSCAVCNGHPGCPCCSEPSRTIPCPFCEGEGYAYYDGSGNGITAEEYNKLPAKERDREPCDHCGGDGEIEDDYEPDYDRYDE